MITNNSIVVLNLLKPWRAVSWLSVGEKVALVTIYERVHRRIRALEQETPHIHAIEQARRSYQQHRSCPLSRNNNRADEYNRSPSSPSIRAPHRPHVEGSHAPDAMLGIGGEEALCDLSHFSKLSRQSICIAGPSINSLRSAAAAAQQSTVRGQHP